MASFNSTIITNKGHDLMAKIVAGTAQPNFTKINVSDYQYASGTDFEALTSMTSVKQTALVSSVSKVNDATVKVSAGLNNASLATGYYLRAIGLYAIDPQEGEILYSITTAIEPDWIPPNSGVSASSIMIDLITVVSNADNVSIDVDPNATATVSQIQALEADIADVKGFVGYTESDIYGVEVDFENRTFKRLAGSIGKLPGADFNGINAFGGRKRCSLTDDGKVLAYYGDPGYSESGATTQEITVDSVTYPAGTTVQAMVEQPKFYYKVVPLKLDPIQDGIGWHMRKARYYVSDTPKTGFKVHPAFVRNNVEVNKIYLPAYEASIFDVSAGAYLLADEQIADFTASTGDKLSSIANAKPASGYTQNLTRGNTRILASNRGEGWQQKDVLCASASQMLMTIEYAGMNMQTAIGAGVTNKASGEVNESELTGATTNLGNDSGSVTNVNGYNVITYRGEENFYGNIWKWIDGLNIECNDLHYAWYADNGFVDNIKTSPYKNAGFTIAKVNGYISAIGWSETCDFLFLPSETSGDSSLPVGDYLYQNAAYAGFLVALLGGRWDSGSGAGAFCWALADSSSGRGRAIGGGAVYVPQAA